MMTKCEIKGNPTIYRLYELKSDSDTDYELTVKGHESAIFKRLDEMKDPESGRFYIVDEKGNDETDSFLADLFDIEHLFSDTDEDFITTVKKKINEVFGFDVQKIELDEASEIKNGNVGYASFRVCGTDYYMYHNETFDLYTLHIFKDEKLIYITD